MLSICSGCMLINSVKRTSVCGSTMVFSDAQLAAVLRTPMHLPLLINHPSLSLDGVKRLFSF